MGRVIQFLGLVTLLAFALFVLPWLIDIPNEECYRQYAKCVLRIPQELRTSYMESTGRVLCIDLFNLCK